MVVYFFFLPPLPTALTHSSPPFSTLDTGPLVSYRVPLSVFREGKPTHFFEPKGEPARAGGAASETPRRVDRNARLKRAPPPPARSWTALALLSTQWESKRACRKRGTPACLVETGG